MSARKYAMIRVEAGDWILPGNDGETIFRLVRFDGGAWSVWVWVGPWDGDAAATSIVEGDWSPWEERASGLATRLAAIEEVLALVPS